MSDDRTYKVEHSAPGPEDAPLYDVTVNGVFPEDIYSDMAARYYGDGRPADNYIVSIIHLYRNQPDKKIKIYRAVPKNINVINPGDWVTFYKPYAKSHAHSDNPKKKLKIISKVISAKELYTDGNSIYEWGYWPTTR